jgi:hypothetical protein
MRKALGLFHFNIQYISGDTLFYHRYATQVIIPFLQLIAEDPRYCVSFEIAGYGLEFLAEHYPNAIALLRRLVDSGNIELVSSTYAPTLWVAFPARDLRMSVELNRRTLNRLGLRSAPIFFAQEAFFGQGLREIADLFTVALCKDDYIENYRADVKMHQAFQLGSLKVLVGRRHIRDSLNELQRGRVVTFNLNEDDPSPFWYHMGSGHHLVCPAHPHAWAQFFAEEDWIQCSRRYFQQLLDEDMQFGAIMEYAESISHTSLEPWPFLPEGSWSARRSEGVYTWMGRHTHSWEADSEILGLVWRARRLVRKLDKIVANSSTTFSNSYQDELLEAWRLLIFAESSDSFGWRPLREEVQSGRIAAEEALRCASSLLSRMPIDTNDSDTTRSLDTETVAIIPCHSGSAIDEQIKLVGCTGVLRWSSVSPEEKILDIELTATEPSCGVEFLRSSNTFCYSPSGIESEAHVFDPAAFSCDEIYLPLANGYISLSDDLHLIRFNIYGQVAARVCSASNWVSFITSGIHPGKRFHWRFLLLCSDLDMAVARANDANYI